MRSTSPSPIVHGYSVVRIAVDEERDETTPVGVVAWDSDRPWYNWRLLAPDENVAGVYAWNRKFLEIVREQLGRWADSRRVPYAASPVEPTSDRFWNAASKVLTTAVRLSRPRAMDPMKEPDDEIEALFEAVVQPKQPPRRQSGRIDGQISRALGSAAKDLPKRIRVAAYGGAREQVRRGAVTDRGVLLVDGVNLAARRARDAADALVSRFRRIRDAQERQTHIVVGYTSSPGGLNGETHMRDWIRQELTEQVFDLTTEEEEFRAATLAAWREVVDDPQKRLV